MGSWAYTPGPATLSATGAAGKISLSWTAPSGAKVTQYQVLRGTSPGGESLTPIATTAATTYGDASAVPGQTYYYEVVAINSAGSGPFSNEASGAVGKVGTSTGVVSSLNPSSPGGQVTYTATVTPVPDGGTVAFDDGGTAIGGCGTVALTAGTATCQVLLRRLARTRSP